MLNRQKLFIWFGIVVTILLAISVIIFFFANITPNGDENSTETENTALRGRVYVQDLHKHVSSATQDSLEYTLYDRVKDTPDLYTATIRSGSQSKRVTASKQTIINMLIDVEPAELTYAANLTSYPGGYTVNVQCAPINQQMNPGNLCKGDLHP
jgi:hypothetical protein